MDTLVVTLANRRQVESGRALGGGETDSDELHIIPIVFVGVASKLLQERHPHFQGLHAQSSRRAAYVSTVSSSAATLQCTFSSWTIVTTLSLTLSV